MIDPIPANGNSLKTREIRPSERQPATHSTSAWPESRQTRRLRDVPAPDGPVRGNRPHSEGPTMRPHVPGRSRQLVSVGAAVLIGIAAEPLPGDVPGGQEWIDLFNGRDLAGWIPKISGHDLGDNFANTFRVRDGLLQVRYDGYDQFDDQFGHLFYETPYSHYRLIVEYRFVGEQAPGGAEWARRNSGVMIHSQDPHTMTHDQDFPISVEVQLLGGLGEGPRPTANVCTPGTEVVIDGVMAQQHCINSRSATYDGDQWVRSETIVRGDSLIIHLVNGDTVLQYTRPQVGGGVVNGYDPAAKPDGAPLRSGFIALQSESHPIDFRVVRLLNLEGR